MNPCLEVYTLLFMDRDYFDTSVHREGQHVDIETTN